MFQGLALVDLANLKWGDIRDIEVLDKEKYARDSGEYGVDYANENKEVQDYYEINVAHSKTNKPVRILVEQMTVLPFLLPFTEAIKNSNVCRCRKSSYICDVKWCRKAIGDYE